jgi:hypothetical protein
MAREVSTGTCEHCRQQFGYWLLHCRFSDSIYAYCDLCGKTAVLSLWDKSMPILQNCPVHQEMCSGMEPYLPPCDCGGNFKTRSKPRCPHCNNNLSAEFASSYLERNAAGTQKGWRWQRDWSGLYCIVVEDKWIENNLR